MTKRVLISTQQNKWSNSQLITEVELDLEQNYNNATTSAIINNHIGTGVVPEALTQKVLFDSDLLSEFLDGVIIQTQTQPTDNNFGNQLEIILTDSLAAGKRNVKVCVIGLDFQSNLQYETFVFKTNEIQVGKKHFTKILLILFNDFIGDPSLSFNLGGRVVIKEAKPMTLSRDAIMVSQNVEPNLFFRDFFVEGFASLQLLLQAALPLYNIDTLDIFTGVKDNKVLLKNDVTTQIGQKFLATTNNIQKATLLLSVQNQDVGHETDLVWNGDLVVSIYPLQSTIENPSDIAPNLQIDFAPTNVPVAQISINYASLLSSGVILDSIPQPIDFVFSNSVSATGNAIIPGNYYAVTIKRSGSANKCDILIAAGSDRTDNSRITTFTGVLWVDIPEQDLWFEIWTDAVKISDGQAYESGHGVVIPKTTIDSISLATVDSSFGGLQFVGNNVFSAVLAAVTLESAPIPDQRTGDPVDSKKQFVPQVQLLNTIDIANLEKASEPLILGAVTDKNRKFFDSLSSLISSKLYSSTMAENELLIRIVDDPTDGYRFDTSVSSLITNLLNGDLIGAKFFPNANNSSIFYRIADARLCSMLVGDVNGDGVIDEKDLDLLNTYLDYNLNVGLPLNTSVITDGYTTTYTNGYTTYTKEFSDQFSVSFQLVDPITHAVVASGIDGILVKDPNDKRLAEFTSATVNFNTIIGLSSFKLVLLTPSNVEDYGAFDIVSLDATDDVLTIRKVFLTGEAISQMLRADIDGDFHITAEDGYLLQNYIERVQSPILFPTTFPAPTTNPYTKIGSQFNVLKFRLEEFTDRTDDYSAVTTGRPGVVHPNQDIFANDGYFYSHDFLDDPSLISIQKQLVWDDSLIVYNSDPKLVPSVFTSLTGLVQNSCSIDGVQCSIYGSAPDFDPGKVDQFVPNNLILGTGDLQRPDGSFYKVDFEVGTIILEIPPGLIGQEKSISLMDDFISDYTGKGITRLGFPAMRFSDCSLVKSDALTKNQIRFSVAVQSFSPNTNGLSSDGYAGVLVDGKMGVAIDYSTGILTLNFTNLFQDIVLQTLSTKVQIHVYLKKGGFNNAPLFVSSDKVRNMLELMTIVPPGSLGSGGPGETFTDKQRVGIVAGSQSTSNTIYTSIGTIDFNPDEFHPATSLSAAKQIIFKVALETTSGLTGFIRLYDQTLGSVVAGTELSTTSSVSTIITSSALTFPDATHVYEVHIKLTGIPGPSDRVTCKLAQLEISFV